MCNCKNIIPQSEECYAQMIVVDVPSNINISGNCDSSMVKEKVCIDPCIYDEIISLWKLGIGTTGCCCGHNTHEAYIGVRDEFIPQMKELGYEVRFNNCRPNDDDSFIPKTV